MIQTPGNEKKILLHCCCAPCSCSILQRLIESGVAPTVYFYNPNIDPSEEYDRRKAEVLRYVQKMNIPFEDGDRDAAAWEEKVRGYESEPERGKRCDLCFEMRLLKTAELARQKGFRIFATSLGISRWKDLDQVNRAGAKAAAAFPGLVYWDQNWRIEGGQEQMARITKDEAFYRQRYCGCLYSLRGSLRRGLSRGPSGDQPAR